MPANWHWAEGPEGRELRSGNVPSRDGSDYDESQAPPTLSGIYNALQQFGIRGRFIIIAIGKLGSPDAVISGIASKPMTSNDILNAANRPGRYMEKMQSLFDTNLPFKHIACIIIRPL